MQFFTITITSGDAGAAGTCLKKKYLKNNWIAYY